MALTDAEIEATRFHLGYGNLDYGAYPYTSDGFKQLFRDVVGPNITIGAETTASTAIGAGSVVVAPVSMTGIVAQARLVVDVADAAETVVVAATTATTFTATFASSHPLGIPICVQSGMTRLRTLLHQADKAWAMATDGTMGVMGGIKKADQDVEFFQGFRILRDKLSVYKAIAIQISLLTRVPPMWQSGGPQTLEAY